MNLMHATPPSANFSITSLGAPAEITGCDGRDGG
jgi:hypothetical protein